MKIHLHGYLKELHPKEIQVQASSVAEAISALQLIPALNTGKLHELAIPGFNSRDALYDKTDVEEIHLHPVVSGGGGNGLGQIIIGIAAIAVGMYTGNMYLIQAGISLTLGGVLQLLAPQPELTSVGTEEHSRYLGQPKNTVAIGTRIPLLYGRRKAFGHYISFDVDAIDLKTAPASWYASVFNESGLLTSGTAPLDSQIPLPNTVDGSAQTRYLGIKTSTDINDTRRFLDFSPEIDLAPGNYTLQFPDGRSTRTSAVYESGVLKIIVPVGFEIPDSLIGRVFTITEIKARYE